MRSTNPRRYLISFLVKFPVQWRQNHVWGPICVPSYDHIHKNIHFCKGKGREGEGREGREGKEGRKEERKGGREEERKGGREERICYSYVTAINIIYYILTAIKSY